MENTMKEYVHCSKVKAMPMRRFYYMDYCGLKFPATTDEDGYLVEHPNLEPNHKSHEGLVEWLNKDEFEKDYFLNPEVAFNQG